MIIDWLRAAGSLFTNFLRRPLLAQHVPAISHIKIPDVDRVVLVVVVRDCEGGVGGICYPE